LRPKVHVILKAALKHIEHVPTQFLTPDALSAPPLSKHGDAIGIAAISGAAQK
jgi:hypothetical protein